MFNIPRGRETAAVRRLKLWFRSHWMQLAHHGACDAWGGAECLRVLREWQDADYPVEIREFIRRRANIDSAGNEPANN